MEAERLEYRRLLSIAHRGASGTFPENTLAAFAGAVAAGADMCELDVRLTRDGMVVVIHDDTVDRTTDGYGTVAELTLGELRKLDAGVRFATGFAGERVPTLEEVIRLLGRRCALNVEIKDIRALEQACRLLQEAGLLPGAIISSFDYGALAAARSLPAKVRLGVLGDSEPQLMLEAAVSLGAVAVHPHFDLISSELCQKAHQLGLQVYTWTIDEPAMMGEMAKRGVDGIMTNFPQRLAELRGN